jgi:hypothetical protein
MGLNDDLAAVKNNIYVAQSAIITIPSEGMVIEPIFLRKGMGIDPPITISHNEWGLA